MRGKEEERARLNARDLVAIFIEKIYKERPEMKQGD
jgi:hypothetical protein